MVNELSEKLIYELVVKKAITKAITLMPFFGLPIVNPFFVAIAEKLYSILYAELKEEGQLLMIAIKTEFQEKKYSEAVNELKTVIDKGASDEEVKVAKDEFKKRLHDLISFKS